MKNSYPSSVPRRLMGAISIFRLIAGSLGMVFIHAFPPIGAESNVTDFAHRL